MNVDRARLLPVVMIALALFALAKAADVYVGFTSAEAAPAPREPLDPAPAPEGPAPASVSDERLLNQLAARRAELDRREAALETREALLRATETRIEGRLVALDEREGEIFARESAARIEDAARVAKLSDAYERMKPRDAARIFEALDAALLGSVASGMRTQALASVLGEMEAGKAKALTELLARVRTAERRGSAPEKAPEPAPQTRLEAAPELERETSAEIAEDAGNHPATLFPASSPASP